MADSKISLLLHPIRMRIVQTLVGDRRLSVQQMAQRLPDIPQATLYRHLNKLADAGVLTVVEENKVRGTIEKIYAISEQLERSSQEEAKEKTSQEYFNFFFSFVMNLLGDFESYLQQEDIDLKADGVSFRQVNLYLSDEEYATLFTQWGELLMEAMKNEPTEERRLRTLSTIVMPQVGSKGSKSKKK